MNNDSKNQSFNSEHLLEDQRGNKSDIKPFEIDSNKVTIAAKISKACSKVFTKNFWSSRLPIFSWITTYNPETFLCDTIAGVTTALILIPQAVLIVKLEHGRYLKEERFLSLSLGLVKYYHQIMSKCLTLCHQ